MYTILGMQVLLHCWCNTHYYRYNCNDRCILRHIIHTIVCLIFQIKHTKSGYIAIIIGIVLHEFALPIIAAAAEADNHWSDKSHFNFITQYVGTMVLQHYNVYTSSIPNSCFGN